MEKIPVLPASFLKGGGEMGALVRSKDWSHTPIGRPDAWPASLRTTLHIVLNSPFPQFLFWGAEHLCFYNDAYCAGPGINGMHPHAFGAPAQQVWPEVWPAICPLIQDVMSGGEARFGEDRLLPIHRNGQPGDDWTFSYSAVIGDTGAPAGVIVTCMESTRKVTHQKNVAASEERFRNLVGQATIGVAVLMGPELTAWVANEFFCRAIGKSCDEVIDRSIFEVVPEAEAYFRHIIEHVQQTGQPLYLYDYPYFVYQNDQKKEGYLDLVYQPYREADGAITGVMVLVHDVTLQVQTRHKLRDAEEKARLAISSAELGAFEVDMKTGKVDTDSRFNAIFGFDRWVSREELTATIHPDDQPVRQQAYEEAMVTNYLHYEARVCRKDGSLHWIKVKGRLFRDDEGAPLKILGVVQDITEQKQFAVELSRQVAVKTGELQQANEELAGVLNASLNGIYSLEAVCNEDGRITDFRFRSMNQACMQYMELTPAVIGTSFLDLYPDNRQNGFFECFCRVVATGEPVREEQYFTRAGKDKWLEYVIVRRGNTGVVVTFRDVTDRIKARQQPDGVPRNGDRL